MDIVKANEPAGDSESALQKEQVRCKTLLDLNKRVVSTVSHDVRSSLGAILGMAELLGEQGLDDESSEMVASIVTAGQELMKTVANLVESSRAEMAKLEG